VIGLGTVGYVSSASLINLVSTANLINYVSTANLVSLVSTANLINLISTVNTVGGIAFTNLSTTRISAAQVFTSSIGVNCNAPSYPIDVFGIARSGIPISSITGTNASFGNFSYGIYYYITNSAFSNIALTGTTAASPVSTLGTAPSIGTGWYVTLRNNTGSYLTTTINGYLNSTPASPLILPPANAITIAYDAALVGGAGYVLL
jgi:hypothetical protein